MQITCCLNSCSDLQLDDAADLQHISLLEALVLWKARLLVITLPFGPGSSNLCADHPLFLPPESGSYVQLGAETVEHISLLTA